MAEHSFQTGLLVPTKASQSGGATQQLETSRVERTIAVQGHRKHTNRSKKSQETYQKQRGTRIIEARRRNIQYVKYAGRNHKRTDRKCFQKHTRSILTGRINIPRACKQGEGPYRHTKKKQKHTKRNDKHTNSIPIGV